MNLGVKSFISICLTCCLFALTSCSTQKNTCKNEKVLLFINKVRVKHYPADTPFVYENRINITGNISKDEKTRLGEQLANYWYDSLRAPRMQKFGIKYTLNKPPIYDSVGIGITTRFMQSYLNSQGYFDAAFHDTICKSTFEDQQRVTITMDVNVGNRMIIDSLAYKLMDTAKKVLPGDRAIQRIATNPNRQSKSFIIEGKTPYTKAVIGSELDRLVTIYRKRGYFFMTRDRLYAEIDTTDISLLQLSLDPFEQAQIIADAQEKRKQHPTAIVTVQQTRNRDTGQQVDLRYLKQYYVGNSYFFPEINDTVAAQFPDTLLVHNVFPRVYTDTAHHYSVYYGTGLFKNSLLYKHTYMLYGGLYNENRYLRTVNGFNQLGPWKQVDTRWVVRNDTLDFYYFLSPAKKQNITYNLEASRNTGDFLSSSNLFGLSLNVTYLNRNFGLNHNRGHSAVQSSTSLSTGIELSLDKNNTSTIQSTQIFGSQIFSFPELLLPWRQRDACRLKLDAARTLINISGSYADRKDFFIQQSLIGNLSYEFRKKNILWQVHPLNVEIYGLKKEQGLIDALEANAFLRTSFNTGTVIGPQLNFNLTYPSKRNNSISNYVNLSVELAGLGLGLIPSLQDNIYQYVKFGAEYRKLWQFTKTSVAYRFFGGVGYNYSNDPEFGKTLPFFKQFIAGGPNSMRGWGLRLLGLGSSLLSDTSSSTFRDRYGDFQLETNLEYRFLLAHFSSVNINGAFFTDIGNLWNLRTDSTNPNSEISVNRFGKDIAIAAGTGLRFDFSYFIIRLDLGFKVKDPAKLTNDGWLSINHFSWRNKEFAKYDSQGNLLSPPRNNYAIQLGIGLPF